MRARTILAAALTAVMTAGAAQALAQGTGTTQAPKKPAAKAPGGKAPAAVRSTSRPASFQPVLLHPEKLIEKAPDVFDVKFETTKGDFTIRVTRAWSPNGADRFYNLVKHHFYDGASFFRVLDGFVAQFGLSAYPAVSKAWSNATIKDDPVKQSNKNGFVTYAKSSAPNSRTTQVFINLGDNSRLDRSGFAPFGEVVDGMMTVVKLYGGYLDGADMGGNGPLQGLIESRGKTYVDKDFPKLDSIKSAGLVAPGPPAAAAPPKQ